MRGRGPAASEIEYFPTSIGCFILTKRAIEKSGVPNSHSEVLCPDLGVVLLSSFRRKSESSYFSWIPAYAGMTGN